MPSALEMFLAIKLEKVIKDQNGGLLGIAYQLEDGEPVTRASWKRSQNFSFVIFDTHFCVFGTTVNNFLFQMWSDSML